MASKSSVSIRYFVFNKHQKKAITHNLELFPTFALIPNQSLIQFIVTKRLILNFKKQVFQKEYPVNST